MAEHILSEKKMSERERQLTLALLDCAGVCYDANFTKNQIMGEPIQIIDGKAHKILESIGLGENSKWTEIVEYWADKMPDDEHAAFVEFSDIERIINCYRNGKNKLIHKFRTYDVLGNPMLAEQVMRVYEDEASGDILGIIYVTNAGEQEYLRKQAKEASDKNSFLETMAENLPGGYHRCSTEDDFVLSFVSNSFLDITGYTRQQLEEEADNRYINIVAPEDREYFMSMEPELSVAGKINCVYRIRRRDGELRWVQDSTQYVERNGEKYYQCTLADIHDFVNELDGARQAAEESSMAKSTFLFNASHDIRTPMNAIQGFARIIESNADNKEIVLEMIRKISKSSSTLMTLLNDVLELSRIEHGKDKLNLAPVNLYDQGKNLHEMFASEMEAAGITFLTEVDFVHNYVFCDTVKLARIGMNFLSNAKKFTPKGGTVLFGAKEISSDDECATYRFYVRDTGIGMSEEFLSKAFGQFERERTSTESGIAGSGLGLSITKKLVDLMGGECEIKSELGKGTEISAILTFKIVDENEIINNRAVPDNVDMTGKRVLLVEDNEFNREIAKYILEGMKFAVDEAENGIECVDMLIKSDAGYYDLILMDIQMPVMDGYKAAEEIRNIEDKEKASVPIIAMTANAFDEDKKKCFEVGMNGHIGKPIESGMLVKVISEILLL